MIIKRSCKYCGKTTDITSEIALGTSGKLLVFACGHSYIEESLSQHTTKGSVLEQLETEQPEYCSEHERLCIKSFSSHTGKHFFPYQRDGIVAATKANAKFIFADEMGLGKTIQGLATIALNREELLPALVICKSIAKTNWLWETMDWLQIPAQVIYSSSETPFDMFKVHILSHDMVNRLEKMFKLSEMITVYKCSKCERETETVDFDEQSQQCQKKTTKIHEASNMKCECGEYHLHTKKETTECDGIMQVKPFASNGLYGGQGNGLKDENKKAWSEIIARTKTIIIDESHLIKNPEAQRTKAIKKLSSLITQNNKGHVMGMSGTPIKNNATEWFSILNIVKPEKFWRYNSFCNNYVRYEFVKTAIGYSQKFTGLRDPEHFKEMTKDYMIRRTVDEVLPELPKLFKKQKFVEMDKDFREVYDQSEKDFVDWYNHASASELYSNLLAQLALLRHQTSLAKVDYTIDLALEFLMSIDENKIASRKLAIFTHHIDSREILADRLINFLRETKQSEKMVHILTTGKDVQEEIKAFQQDNDARIIILSTLAHGESINLQFMSDCILHERQWNPANEDQAISGRFRRIGQEAKSIDCMIPVALGTIDEYFVELVERKKKIGEEIDTGEISTGSNSGFIAELAETIVSKGRSKWKL